MGHDTDRGAARWQRERRALLAALEQVERRRDPRLVWSAELAELFDGPDAVLAALGARWSRALEARLDGVFDLPDPERDTAADTVAAELAALAPALHAVLAHHATHPVVVRARRRDLARADLIAAHVHAEHRPARYRAPAGSVVGDTGTSTVRRRRRIAQAPPTGQRV